MVAKGEFVEWANVHGNLYGTSKRAVADVSADGKVCVLDIDVQGARSVANNAPELNAFLLFVLPPTPEELERRLRSRGTETEEAIQKRLANSTGEVGAAIGEFMVDTCMGLRGDGWMDGRVCLLYWFSTHQFHTLL